MLMCRQPHTGKRTSLRFGTAERTSQTMVDVQTITVEEYASSSSCTRTHSTPPLVGIDSKHRQQEVTLCTQLSQHDMSTRTHARLHTLAHTPLWLAAPHLLDAWAVHLAAHTNQPQCSRCAQSQLPPMAATSVSAVQRFCEMPVHA